VAALCGLTDCVLTRNDLFRERQKGDDRVRALEAQLDHFRGIVSCMVQLQPAPPIYLNKEAVDVWEAEKRTASATRDGIATGLSRALVALEDRLKREAAAVKAGGMVDRDWAKAHENMECCAIVRELLEATAGGKR
jgi:hypothetical protein